MRALMCLVGILIHFHAIAGIDTQVSYIKGTTFLVYYINSRNEVPNTFEYIEPLTLELLCPVLEQSNLIELYRQNKKDIELHEFSGEFSEMYIDIFKFVNHRYY